MRGISRVILLPPNLLLAMWIYADTPDIRHIHSAQIRHYVTTRCGSRARVRAQRLIVNLARMYHLDKHNKISGRGNDTRSPRTLCNFRNIVYIAHRYTI